MTTLLLLGRPQWAVAEGPRGFPIRKTCALLVLLALGGSAPRARLAAWLWPNLDESTGRRNLRRELARIADLGAGPVLLADGDYLSLHPSVDVDVLRFDAACAAGRHAEALALWRGPVADGLQTDDLPEFAAWLEAERERRRDQWRRALEATADAGSAEQSLAALHTLLADDPLQERHHRALIKRHLADGRREDALAQYRRCRSLLADELGLTPMAETEALIAAVQADAPVPAPAPVLPGVLPFVGREDEVRLLEAAWSKGGLIVIEGEGGVGKTRLAVDFCAAHGPYALARCRPGDAGVPYTAFTRALRALAGEALAGAGLPPWVNHELARIVPELGAVPAPLASAEDRARFVEACVHAWQRLADGDFDAVIVDDWQHADESSQALIGVLAQRLQPDAARLLLLARPGPLPLEAAALHLRLSALPAEPVFALVQQLSGAAAPTRFSERLRRATGGNPYFIAETLRHLVETGALQIDAEGRWSTSLDEGTDDYRELPLPASVRDAVLARVQRLPDAPRRLLEAASLASEPFAPALLAAACALSEMEALAAIEAAVVAALLREHESGGYGFAHDLAQQALEAALPPVRRRLVHRRLALAAEATHADPALTALHFEAGGEPARAVAFRLAAGDDAQRLFAGAQALRHWQQALSQGPTLEQAAQLHLRCAQALMDLGDGEQAQDQLRQLRGLIAGGALGAEMRMRSLVGVAELENSLGRSPQALSEVEAAQAQWPDGAMRAQALRVRGHALQNLGRLEEAAESVQAALALWTGHSAEVALERAALLDTLVVIEYSRGATQRSLALAREASAIWQGHGDRRSIAKGHYRIGVLLILAGEPGAAMTELETARRLAAEMHLIEQERDAIVNLIKIHADRGDAQRMLALADEGWNLSPRFSHPRLRQILLQARCHAHGLLGDLGQSLSLAEQILADADQDGEPMTRQYAVLNMLDLLVYLGEFDRGRELLGQIAGASELGYLGVKLALNLAFLESRAGRPAAARQALLGAGDPALLDQVQDRCTHALRLAEIQLAEGDAAAAQAGLEPWRDGIPNVELQALVWAVRLQAEQALGEVSIADWQRALELLRTVPMPAPDALALRHALAQTAPDPAQRQALARDFLAARDAMANTLNDRPALRAGFLSRFGPLATD